ncbi:hypothetical protein Trydic_g11259 [Trypoxylus dichotomus]
MSLKTGSENIHPGMTATTKGDGNFHDVENDVKTKGAKSETGQMERCAKKTCNLQCQQPPTPKVSIVGDSSAKHKNISQCCPCGSATTYMEAKEPICKCGLTPEKKLELERERRLRLETEIERMKLQIADMMQSKCMALNMTKQLKQRYEKMKGAQEDSIIKLANLQRENELLSRTLEKQRMEKIKTESSVQVTKDFDRVSLRKMKQQAEKIKTLNDSLMSLSRTVEDKDFEKKRLEHEKAKIHEKLKRNKDMTKKLSETNAKLAKSVRHKHDSLLAIRTKADQYEKELTTYKEEVRRSQLELDRLKNKMERQKNKGDTVTPASPTRSKHDTKSDIPEILGEKLKKTKEKERRASETIQLLTQKIRDLEHKDPKSFEKELQRVKDELKAMRQKYADALSKLKQFEEADKKKSEAIQNEMKNFADSLAAKEEAYLAEKEKMKQLIEELQAIVEQQRVRIAELEAIREQQDVVIRTQTEQLNSKEEQIKLREKENDLVKEQCLDLDKQVDNLRTSIDHFEQIGVRNTNVELRERINNLSDEVDSLKATLRNEQMKSSTKDQVIEDQYNQIQDLKKKLRDVTALSRESNLRAKASEEYLEKTTRQLAKEKIITKQAITQLTGMQKKKKRIEKDVESLEKAYQEISSISELDRLDKEQKMWDEEKKKLTAERDRAIDAAKMATKTLMETMDDFQGQIKSQQKLQKIVADIISTKSDPRIKHARFKEAEYLKKLQVAIPCKPTVPRCTLQTTLPRQKEEFYNAGYSSHSDSDDASGALGILNFLGRYSNYPSMITPPCLRPTIPLQPSYHMPSISRPMSPADCRCANVQNLTCRCAQINGVHKCSCRKTQQQQ